MSIKANGKDLKTLRVQNSGRPHSPGGEGTTRAALLSGGGGSSLLLKMGGSA